MTRRATDVPDWTALRDTSIARSPLGTSKETVERVSKGPREAGLRAAAYLASTFDKKSKILIVGGPTDFDGYAGGLVSGLEGKKFDVRVACLWMDTANLMSSERSTSRQIMRSYIDHDHADSDELVVALNVIEDVATAITALLWGSHKSPSARCHVASMLVGKGNLLELLEEADVCFGTPPNDHIETVADLHGQLVLSHPYPGINIRRDNIAYLPPIIVQRKDLRASLTRTLK